MSRPDSISLNTVVPSLGERVAGGMMLLVLGAAMLGIARNYPMGRMSDMGAGFVPIWVGMALFVMGLVILVTDLRPRPRLPNPGIQWRELAFVSASILAFAALIQPAGLVPSMFVAVALSKFGDRNNSLLSIVIYAVLAALAGWGLFLFVLELSIPAFWR